MSARVRAGAAVTGVLILLTAGCSGDEKEAGVAGEKAEAAAPQVTIDPGDGNTKALPEAGVTVKTTGGTLQKVTLSWKNGPITQAGTMSADKTSWKSRTLKPGTRFQVSALAVSPEGKTTTVNADIATAKAERTLEIADIIPRKGEKVGVGMPITVTFNREVDDKKAVERALRVKSAKPATGAWYWVTDKQVIFRTENDTYWKPNQEVSFEADLAGVKSGKGTYGTKDAGREFRIGDSHILKVSTKSHKAVAYENGKKVRTWPISGGKGGRVVNGVDTYLTTSGVHLTMGKENPAIMTSEWMGVDPKDKANGGYREVIPWAVRISSSGEYVHSMASTVWAQGEQNVSHGCINSPPKDARWFYKWSYRGDPVVTTGSKRELQWNNGWSYYQMSWDKWVKGSALNRTVTTG
ncbi:Ig-like domain-containing protein [Actinomadura sp. WMMB 499]|uniref:L,D-transpeptidase n=1 Tax=Actinomadura sp. WMMB 499 TaxID=1219491 RepID=UPI0020C7DEDF|nr:Ig-like domain-containing protein [Actinomadura sp. WMMB 499]